MSLAAEDRRVDATCRGRSRSTFTTCRCPACSSKHRRADKLSRVGALPPRRSAEAWAEVDRLRNQGWSIEAIADAAGLPHTTIRGAIVKRDHGAAHEWSRGTAEAILTHAPTPTIGKVGTIGLTRRIQALSALGWGLDELAAACGLHWRTLHIIRAGRSEAATRHVDDAIRRLYADLQMRPGPSEQARTNAARRGWAPPLAWDDDTIDDPTARPDRGARTKGRLVDLDDWCHLVSLNVNPDEAARRCGVADMDSIEMAAVRHHHAPALRWLATLTLARNPLDANGRETVDILASRARRLRALADKADTARQEDVA